jgi:hypothetical protein
MTCRPSVRPLFRRLPRPMARICLRWFSKPPPSDTRDNGSLDRYRDIEAFDSEPKAWFYQEAETDRNTFAVISLWGKFGALYACAATFLYIVPLLNTFLTRLFSKTRLKRKDFLKILRLPWAQEVSGSNPDAPTKTSRVFSWAYQDSTSPNSSLWNSPRQEVWIRKSFNSEDFSAR